MCQDDFTVDINKRFLLQKNVICIRYYIIIYDQKPSTSYVALYQSFYVNTQFNNEFYPVHNL